MLNYPLLPLAARGRVSRNRFTIVPHEYSLPPLPNEFRAAKQLNGSGQVTFDAVATGIRLRINGSLEASEKAALEQAAMDWLYTAVRRNVLRGRVFELQRIITERRADCLGYARLFELLGRNLGLDIGIAEVIVDNAGRYVPHFVNLLRISDGTTRFVDAWYGSTDILHRRMGLHVRQDHYWAIRDVESSELRDFAGVRGIPPRCVYATTLFMLGNRHLERSLRGTNGTGLDLALQYYHTAIALYPENPRFYFNRAIAFENEGMGEEARSDYAIALADETCLIRLLARQHEEVLGLMDLDEKGINQRDQEVYLLHKGFTTGTITPTIDVALQSGLTVEEVEEITKRVETARSRS
jgi:tetratricopeptide (TPR) repeat protein